MIDENLNSTASTGESTVIYYKTVEVPQVHFIDEVMEMSTVSQRQVPVIQKVLKIVEVPRVQSIGEIVDVLVVAQRQVPFVTTAQKTVEVPQVQFRDEVVDVPVVTQRQVLQERILERIVENTNVPVSSVKEEIIDVMQHGLTETMKEKTGRQGELVRRS